MNKYKQFFIELKEKLREAINKKELDFTNLKKFINIYKNPKLIEPVNHLSNYSSSILYPWRGLIFYHNIFRIVQSYIKNLKKRNKSIEIQLTSEFIQFLIEKIIDQLVFERLCSECYSRDAFNITFPISRDTYYCERCQKKVEPLHWTQNLLIFILYIKDWAELKSEIDGDHDKDFIIQLFINCLQFFLMEWNLSATNLFYKILEKNNVEYPLIQDKKFFKRVLIEKIKKSLENQDFFDFLEGKAFYNEYFGNLEQDMEDLTQRILKMVINSLRSGGFFKFKYAIEHYFKHRQNDLMKIISDQTMRVELEEIFYEGLSNCLANKDFESFSQLFDYSYIFGMFIDVKQIPNRFEIIFDLLRESISGYNLGEIFEILRFANKYNLLDKDFSKDELNLIQEVKKDNLFLANLEDLFGTVSNALILYVRQDMPKNAYHFMMIEPFFSSYKPEQTMSMLLMHFLDYFMYGLNIKKIGTIDRFLKKYYHHYEQYIKQSRKISKGADLLKFSYAGKTHLVSPANITKNLKNIKSKYIYNFYSLSMVLLGGLGPQGQGFTYSTPEGEVIEICSDQKENEAIIIRYKEFLKQQFLLRLKAELERSNIRFMLISRILEFLDGKLKRQELINYSKKEGIIKEIYRFLDNLPDYKTSFSKDLQKSIKTQISESIDIILRPINMVDQFKARMDLINEDKISSEDIAKLTSLKEKSHYDVLRERFFFRHIVNWIYEVYKKHYDPLTYLSEE
ncbi:MAG: hypothetical protein ACTSR8_01615 [Promethearchaeota archaeon]